MLEKIIAQFAERKMSNDWINWRFGKYHLQIGPDQRYWISFRKNHYWDTTPYPRWFERY